MIIDKREIVLSERIMLACPRCARGDRRESAMVPGDEPEAWTHGNEPCPASDLWRQLEAREPPVGT